MPESSLQARLGEVADLAGDGFDPPGAAAFAAQRRRRVRTVVTVAAAAAAVVVVAVALTMIGGTRSLSPPPAIHVPIHVPPPSGHVTVARLEHYRWTALPNAPIEPRTDGAVSVWTGTRMIVWGGDSANGSVRADGASYDPATRTWHTLPASPLEPRTSPAYAWTGTKLFIWGGIASGGNTNLTDGATYDPNTDSWHRLPPLPVSDRHAVAVWTGSRILLFTAADGGHVRTVAVHAYDPTTDSWTTMPAIHTGADLLDLSALVTGDQIYVWMPVQTIAHHGLTTGNEGYLYRPRTHSWALTNLLPSQPQYSVGPAAWTGDHIIFDPNGLECSCGGIAGASTGSWADPSTGHVAQIPGPEPFHGATYTWTGAAVLSTSGRTTAAWDPGTNHWTTLATAPNQPGDVQVWTGARLLVSAQSPARSAWLEFAPPAQHQTDCANLSTSVTVGETTVHLIKNKTMAAVHAIAPVQVTAAATGTCSEQAHASISRAGHDIQPTSGGDQTWTLTSAGDYLLTYSVPMCAGMPQPNRCLGGIQTIGQLPINVSTQPDQTDINAVPGGVGGPISWSQQPWVSIHPTDNPKVMLIDIGQDTSDPTDACWVHTRSTAQSNGNEIRITLHQGQKRLPPGQSCAHDLIAGPFYATVHLPVPFDGQVLIDTWSGHRHPPQPMIKLADAPLKYR